MKQTERLSRIFQAARGTAFARIGSRDLPEGIIKTSSGVESPPATITGYFQDIADCFAVQAGNVAAIPDTFKKDGPVLGMEYLLRLATH